MDITSFNRRLADFRSHSYYFYLSEAEVCVYGDRSKKICNGGFRKQVEIKFKKKSKVSESSNNINSS